MSLDNVDNKITFDPVAQILVEVWIPVEKE